MAASSRGERAVLVLETKDKALSTRYRSVEDDGDGVPASSTSHTGKKKSPARARRSQIRLETFMKKKSEEKAKMEQKKVLDNKAAGVTSSCTSNKLVLDLAKQDSKAVGTGLPSPILQVDGESEEEPAKYSFQSSYHEEDVMYTLREIFPPSEVKLTLESRERRNPLDACHICTVMVKPIATDRKLLWPEMNQVQSQVIENVRTILK